MRNRRFLLFMICGWLWTNSANAQQVAFIAWGGDFGRITLERVTDTATLNAEMAVAVKGLAAKRGIVLDLSGLAAPEKLYDERLASAIQLAFAEFTKPTVVLIAQKINWETLLGVWAKERYWTRFESSGKLEKAQSKLKTLNGRHMKEGQDRMDWLMQQKIKK